MKKFISFVMAGAMVASLVPATAFAKGEVTATAKVVDAKDLQKGETAVFDDEDGPEAQMKITSVDYQTSYTELPKMDITLTLDNADFTTAALADPAKLVKVKDKDGNDLVSVTGTTKVNDAVSDVTAYASATAADATGLATNAATGVDYISLSDIEKEYHPAMTASEHATYLEANGWKLSSDGSNYTKAGQTPISVSTLGTAAVTFATLTAANAKYGMTTGSTEGTAGAPYVYVTKTTTKGKLGSVVVDPVSGDPATARVIVTATKEDSDEIKVTISGFFEKDDVVAVDLKSTLTKSSLGTKATVSIDSKMVTADDLVFASILDKGIKASAKKTVDIATEEKTTLSDRGIKIETTVGKFVVGQKIDLKLSSGFEFDKVVSTNASGYSVDSYDDKTLTIKVTAATDEFTIAGQDITIESTSAKSGAVATLTVKAVKDDKITDTFTATATVEVAKVVDYKVNLTVDADEDLPVIYSGTNVDNYGLTDDSDHFSLEVTAEETFPGAWSMRQGFNFNLPEGVYVTDVKIVEQEGLRIDTHDATTPEVEAAFKKAYQDGDHKNFEFGKRVFNDVDTTLNTKEAKLVFQLELVADPTFEGDVELTFEGSLVDTQKATIAKFVKPYTVKAEQNDVIIDYRNTTIKTPIVITEAEEGLWAKDKATFTLSIEDDLLTFEDDATFTVDSDSDLELKNKDTKGGTITFTVKNESDKAASVTLSDLALYMSRSIPAGGYDLEIATSMNDAYNREVLFAPDSTVSNLASKWESGKRPSESDVKKDSYVDDVCDYSEVAKEAFVNVVTSGRDNDNLFTTKVVVPVGEAYIVAGETQVALDVPAYISAAGYTMLPIRAVSKALGVDTNNVLWSAETKTITIMYAQRIITMTVGQKTVYVNGSAIPTSAAPEIKDGRAFLPLRDLGTALGVTNVTWDAATKTATLN